jgi:spore germination protein YaaH
MRYAGWVTYWDFDRGIAAVTDPLSPLEEVYLFSVHLDPTGRPTFADPDIDYPQAVAELRARGLRVWMTVVNDVVESIPAQRWLKDPAVIGRMLEDPDRQRAHRAQLLRLASETGFSGVDIDYENLRPEDRSSFVSFVRDLARELKDAGLKLSVTVQPKVRESSRQGPGAMDWKRLCVHADQLQVMLYNLHSQATPPGPLATPGWVQEVLSFARQQCGVERVAPVLKLSGLRWGPGKVQRAHFAEAVSLMARHSAELQRHPADSVPYFSYLEAQTRYTVYYEDARSLLEKLAAIEALGFRRVIFWDLGRHDPELFGALGKKRGHDPDS